MNLIVALDDHQGMLFNHRRQSQDRILREKILSLAKGHGLWMNAYTAKQFADMPIQTGGSATDDSADGGDVPDPQTQMLHIDEDFLQKAPAGDFCFVENIDVSPYREAFEHIIIFRWNRRYPGDFFFPLSLDGWKLLSAEDFAGSSHKLITKEVYTHES